MFFSIVVPLYNKEKEILATLNSVLSQDFQDYEVLVVNDGSTDAGGDVVCQIQDSRVRYFSQINRGVSAARNLGVKHAQGKYVVFLDADDICSSTHLTTLFHLIKAHPEQVLFSTGHNVQENNLILKVPTPFSEEFSGVVKDPFLQLSKGLSLLNSSTTCVRRDVLTNEFLFPEGVTRGEDLHLWVRLINKFGICHTSTKTITINRDAVLRSNSVKIASIPAHFLIITELFKAGEVRPEYRTGLKKFFLKSALATAAAAKMSGQGGFVYQFITYCFKSDFFKEGVFISVVCVVPNFVFLILRRLRNRRL